MNLLHVQDTNQPAEKNSLDSVSLKSHCLFLEKEHFPLQAHPPLGNPVKGNTAWLMHCLQSSHH